MNLAVTSALLTFTIFGSPATARLAGMLGKKGDFTLPSTCAMFCVPCFHVLLMSVKVASLSGSALNGMPMKPAIVLAGPMLVTVSSNTRRQQVAAAIGLSGTAAVERWSIRLAVAGGLLLVGR